MIRAAGPAADCAAPGAVMPPLSVFDLFLDPLPHSTDPDAPPRGVSARPVHQAATGGLILDPPSPGLDAERGLTVTAEVAGRDLSPLPRARIGFAGTTCLLAETVPEDDGTCPAAGQPDRGRGPAVDPVIMLPTLAPAPEGPVLPAGRAALAAHAPTLPMPNRRRAFHPSPRGA